MSGIFSEKTYERYGGEGLIWKGLILISSKLSEKNIEKCGWLLYRM